MVTLLGNVGRAALGTFSRYVGGALERWDHIYVRGFDDSRRGAAPRAKHYVIAGMIADACGHAPRVLDVGCGFGTTYHLLRALGPRYQGIDASSRAVSRCRARFGGDPGCSFAVADFEHHELRGSFDAIVFDETMPIDRAREWVGQAIRHLSGPRAVIVVAQPSAILGALLRGACRDVLPPPHQRVAVRSGPLAALGSRTLVQAFTRLSTGIEAEDDRAGPPVSGIEGARPHEGVLRGLSRMSRPARSGTAPNRTRPR